MAKKRKSGITKTQAVRDALKKFPNEAPKEIAAKLTARGTSVTPGYVSTIKSGLKKENKPVRTKKTGETEGTNDRVSVSSLINAKAFVEVAGGVDKARQVLDVLAKLR